MSLYSWITFAQAKTALSKRLDDASAVFWIDAELGLYIKESLRTFNSIAQFHRDTCSFTTSSGFAYYDLTQTSDPDANTKNTGSGATNPPALVGYSLKDRDLINDIQYALIEVVNDFNSSSTWGGTDQFTMDDVTRAIERRRNLFLLLTGLSITHSQVAYSFPNTTGRVSLSDSIIDIRRVAWKDAQAVYMNLWRSDEWDSNTYNPGWNSTAATPDSYSFYLTPRVSLQVIPVSDAAGTLDLLTVTAPANLDESTGVLLNVPDDFAWVIKWGALADLLSRDGQAQDNGRARYALNRWDQGIQIARGFSLVEQVVIGSASVLPQSLNDLDFYKPTWQNLTGTPVDFAIAGRNLIAVSPVPTGSSTITLDVFKNQPMPTSNSSNLQIGREQIDAILDYAVHLAMYKIGGDEFSGTYYLLDNFMKQAMHHNERLRAEADNYSIMKSLSSNEMILRPTYIPMQEPKENENAS